MAEPAELHSAREHLSRAEATYRSEDGLFHLDEGLGLLDEVITAGDAGHQRIARNLAATYAIRICQCVKDLVEGDPGLPEPELEHLFKVMLAFDQGDFDLPAHARSTKLGIARRLIDRYYEGHSPADKQKALEQLMTIARGGPSTPKAS